MVWKALNKEPYRYNKSSCDDDKGHLFDLANGDHALEPWTQNRAF